MGSGSTGVEIFHVSPGQSVTLAQCPPQKRLAEGDPECRTRGRGPRAPDCACGFFLTSGRPVDILRGAKRSASCGQSSAGREGHAAIPRCRCTYGAFRLHLPPGFSPATAGGHACCRALHVSPTGGHAVSAFCADVARTGNSGSILEARLPCSATHHPPCCL